MTRVVSPFRETREVDDTRGQDISLVPFPPRGPWMLPSP